MLTVRFQLDSVFARLGALQDALLPSEAVLQPAVAVVARAIERNFKEEGRPARWKPLTPAYARYKSHRWPGKKILQRTGVLRDSIRVTVEPGRGNTAAIVASTDVPYALVHQFGTTFIPPRPFLVLTREDEEAAAQAIATALSEVTLGRGPAPVPPTAGAPPESSQ